MPTISPENTIVTLINVFTVTPENQQIVIDALIKTGAEVMTKQPGFISSTIHKGLDGTHVTNYVQWASKEAFEAMLKDPDAIPHLREIATASEKVERSLYSVVYVQEAH